MKYVLMFAGSVDEQAEWENMPEERRAAAYEQVSKWFEEHGKSGKLVGGEELQGPSSSTTVRIKNGKATVTDGPFIEAKEVIGGFAVVEVKDLDEALAMAKSWPGGGIVEVRPVVDHSNG
ncbi:MAG TPA: YciI family protein [Candidatus Dormibacteraeota bacterium]|nr:YciI family protein [Candidatus Dormibacteraeota bacterium]